MAFLTKYGRKICKNLFYGSSSSYWGLVASFAVLKFSANKANQSYATDVFARLISETKFTQSEQVPSCLTLYRFFHRILGWVLSLSNPDFSSKFWSVQLHLIFLCKKISNYVQVETEAISYVIFSMFLCNNKSKMRERCVLKTHLKKYKCKSKRLA